MTVPDTQKKFSLMYLSSFFSFLIAAALYILLLKTLPISDQVSYVEDLLPYYKPYIVTHTPPLTLYYLAIIFIPITSVVLFSLIFKILQKVGKKREIFIAFLSVIAFVLPILSFILILSAGLSSISASRYVFEITPIIFTKIFIGLFFSGLFFLSLLYLFPHICRLFSRITDKYGLGKLIINFVIIALIILTLSDRIMNEKYLFVNHPRQYVHSVVYISPIYDILSGKVILVDTDSQYGIFINYLPSLIFKYITPLSFTSFFYLLVLYGIIYYIIAYLLFKIRLQNSIWVFLGIITLFSFHFYSNIDRYALPMMFPIRTLLDLPFFLLLIIFGRRQSKRGNLLLSIFVAFSLFYNFEIGFPILAAYFFFLLLYGLKENHFRSISNIFYFLFKHLLFVMASVLLIGLVYSLYAKFTTGYFPDWPRSFFYLMNLSRSTTIDKPNYLFIIPLCIYLTILIRSIILLSQKRANFFPIWESSLSVYGLLILTNFISRGYILNLVSVVVPAIILGMILFRDIYLSVKNTDNHSNFAIKFLLFAPFMIFGFFVIFSLIYYPYRLATNNRYEYWIGDKEYSAKLYSQIEQAADVIKAHQAHTKKVVILSFVDTLLAMKAGKINIIPFSTSQNVITNGQEDLVLRSITSLKPQYIYADKKDSWLINIYPHIYQYLENNYQIMDSGQLIDIWKSNKLNAFTR